MSVIDEYLAKVAEPERAALERIRKIAHEHVKSDLTDTIGYGMPVLKYKGKYLLGFAPFKDHLSVFPGSEPIEVLQDKLKGYTTAKGTVQFTVEEPLPEALITQMLDIRIADIDGETAK